MAGNVMDIMHTNWTVGMVFMARVDIAFVWYLIPKHR
jgi:hypothetical protein